MRASLLRAVLPLLAVLVAAPSLAAELPKRRSGLWEITASGPGQASAPASQLCIDEKTDDLARQMGAGMMTCSRHQVRRDGDAYVIESVCKFGESTATTRARITGRFDAAYEATIESRYEPPLMGLGEGRATVKAKWVGACRPGQRPGDMTLPNGTTINILDAPKPPPR